VIRQLIEEHVYQFKFVIGQPTDCEEVLRYLEDFPQIDRSRVMLMPLGIDIDELDRIGAWLEDYCLQHGFQFCPRRQIEWFGLRRGT
jgi:7-carboxy-7-deazaguanine synthase